MMKLWNLVSGWKTYVVAGASIVYAIYGVYIGSISFNEAVGYVQTALLGGTIRHGIAKSNEESEG